MANATIILLEPIEGPGPTKEVPIVQITQIVLRAPKFPDIMALGEPAAFARSEGGMIFQAEKDEIVGDYIKRLLIEPKDPQLLNQLGLADSLQLKEAVFGFFKAAREAISP
jgi:hypothetical protein